LKIGYGRTSTFEQVAGMESQLRDLRTAGCEKIFSEQASAVAKRPELEALLNFIREGELWSSPSWIGSRDLPTISWKSRSAQRPRRRTSPS